MVDQHASSLQHKMTKTVKMRWSVIMIGMVYWAKLTPYCITADNCVTSATEYLENRYSSTGLVPKDSKGPPIGNGLWGIKLTRDR